MLLTSLLRRHLLGMGLTASALSTTPATKGAIRYRQLWVSADGVTHIDEHECGKLETKDFTSTGGDAALQYVRAFSNSDDFALTGLVVTQQVGENPWHFCPSPQFVVTLEGSWYIRTSDGKTTTFRPGGLERCPFRNAAIASCTRALRHRRDLRGRRDPSHTPSTTRRPAQTCFTRTTPRSTHWLNSERAGKHQAAPSTGAAPTEAPATSWY